MGKLFVLLLIIAAFSGTYWMVMSGYVAEQMVAVGISAAAREPDALSMVAGLHKAEAGLDAQQRWVRRLRFIARDPDWSQLEASRKKLHQIQKEATGIAAVSGGEIGSEGAERLRKYLRSMPPLRTGVFREGEDTLWKVLFWVSGAGVILVGLLLFVRRVGD